MLLLNLNFCEQLLTNLTIDAMEAQLKERLGAEVFDACIHNQRDIVERWISSQPADEPLLTSIMEVAAANDAVDVVRLCLERGCPVKFTVMRALVCNESFATHRAIIEAGAIDINYFVPWFGDCLGVAATSNRPDWVKFCLEQGADPNRNKIDDYKTVLAAASELGYQNVVELLLQHGTLLNGSGALVLAAEAGQEEMVRLLLSKGADVNELGVEDLQDERSKLDIGSALHKAVQNGHTQTALALIEAGADLQLEDSQGRTPGMLAEKNQHQEILQWL